MTFEQLDFQSHTVSPIGVQAKKKIGDYEISVVSLEDNGTYEVAIFDEQGNFIQLPGIHAVDPVTAEDSIDDVIHYLSPADVSGIMTKLQMIAGPSKSLDKTVT
jgi:hypothetical protein|tara:strand:+ start:12260 stop:12571 length:312 start_codon:yes stop_codon:yes gene_type:complete